MSDLPMAPSTQHQGVLRISGPKSDSVAGARVDAPADIIGSTHDQVPGGRSVSFSIHYSNIRGLRSNFSSVEHHLASALPNLLLLSETKLASNASPDPFNISHYNLYSHFRRNGGVCAYCNINTPIARLMDLESPDFDVLWLTICLPTVTIILCFCYCSLELTSYPAFFQYLTSCHEALLLSHPHAEVLYMGDFNVHHVDWLHSSTTDVGGREAFDFSISHELEQIIQHPTRVPDRHGDRANILDLFFTSNPPNYTYSIQPPLGSSDHNLVSVSCSFAHPPPLPPTQRRLWHFDDTQRAELSSYFLDFPWGDYCFRSGDPDRVAPLITEVIVSGMEAYIPYSTKTFSPSKPWFDRACSQAVEAREKAFRSYQSSPSNLTRTAFISDRNRCKLQIRKAKASFFKRKVDSLTRSPTEKAFWSLAKKFSKNFCNSSFPPLFRPDCSIANSPTDKANLFGSLFSANSTLGYCRS